MQEYPTRPRFVLFQLATNGAIGFIPGAIVGVIVGGVMSVPVIGITLGGLVTATLVMSIALKPIRSRKMVIDSGGVYAQRNGFRLRFTWADIEGVGVRKFWGIPMSMLNLSHASVEANDGSAVAEAVTAKLHESGADRAVQLSIYVADWKSGSFGDAVRQHRPDLLGTRQTQTIT
jgi:hypothetical protein